MSIFIGFVVDRSCNMSISMGVHDWCYKNQFQLLCWFMHHPKLCFLPLKCMSRVLLFSCLFLFRMFLVLKQVLVEFHHPSYVYEDLRRLIHKTLCGIVFYGGTNTKLTNKHGPMLMENKGRLSRLSEHFGAALDLKKVKVCVVNKNKSFLQVCIFYPYSN